MSGRIVPPTPRPLTVTDQDGKVREFADVASIEVTDGVWIVDASRRVLHHYPRTADVKAWTWAVPSP